ncbi:MULTISPECIES: hypothetical protein [Caulobacter]|uniref:hypothetical protein n=1 Tax=Caulobacter TaxID=75 RepID=UPI00103FCFC9|nr:MULTISPECIES: hypothetical protein [Caulobacter]MBQ1562158.1 hypothetical protein [Caulobacter sp.]
MEKKLSPVVYGLINGAIIGVALITAFPTVFKFFPLRLVSLEMAKIVTDPADGSAGGWGILLIVGGPGFLVLMALVGIFLALGLSRLGAKGGVRAAIAALTFAAALLVMSRIAVALPPSVILMGLTVTTMFNGPVSLATAAAIAAFVFAGLWPKSGDAN